MNIQEYKEAMVNTLTFWLNVHTKPEAWAENWLVGCSPSELFTELKGELSNDYFEFDWSSAALKRWVKTNRHLFKVCSCGIYERGYEDCDHVGRSPTIAELTEWFEDIYCNDYEAIANLVSDYILEQALIKDGFKAYRAALKDYTHSVEVEVKDVLRQIERAKDSDDLLAALTWANHVNHVNGNIARDYGDMFDLDYELINEISQNGIANVLALESEE